MKNKIVINLFIPLLIFFGCSKEEGASNSPKKSQKVCHSFEFHCDSGILTLQVGGYSTDKLFLTNTRRYNNGEFWSMTGKPEDFLDYFEYSESADSVEFCVDYPYSDSIIFVRHCNTNPSEITPYRKWIYVKGELVEDTLIVTY